VTASRRLRLSVFSTALSLLVGIASAVQAVGHPARMVDVIGLFFGGVGTGAGMAGTAVSVRKARRQGV
jgi:hypothetical protein